LRLDLLRVFDALIAAAFSSSALSVFQLLHLAMAAACSTLRVVVAPEEPPPACRAK
jgi:hypothetical protein